MEDEHRLHEIQQQLAGAWVARDRALIERILAPEWSVTQANGSILSRANVLQAAFDTDALRVTFLVVDDVTVRMFGTTAVVRGFGDPRIQLHVNACNVGFGGNLDRSARMTSGGPGYYVRGRS